MTRFLAAMLLMASAVAPAQQLSASPPTAAAPGSTPTSRLSSPLVVLDLVVEDAQGNIVPNLKREDFHVTEAGEPQTILNFETNGAHAPAPALNIHSTQELDQLALQAPVKIILLDEFNTRFEDMASRATRSRRNALYHRSARHPGEQHLQHLGSRLVCR